MPRLQLVVAILFFSRKLLNERYGQIRILNAHEEDRYGRPAPANSVSTSFRESSFMISVACGIQPEGQKLESMGRLSF
jgi:hypothetical protein